MYLSCARLRASARREDGVVEEEGGSGMEDEEVEVEGVDDGEVVEVLEVLKVLRWDVKFKRRVSKFCLFCRSS